MSADFSTRRLLVGLTVTFLLAGCGAGATPSPEATAAATINGAVATLPPTPAPTPTPTQSPTPTSSPKPSTQPGPPAAPTGATYHDDRGVAPDVTVSVAWHEASPEGVSIWVYGVTDCLASADGAECVTETTKIPPSALSLIRKVPAAAGTTAWTYTDQNIGGALGVYNDVAHYAIILRAVNTVGQSPFVVAGTNSSCSNCTY